MRDAGITSHSLIIASLLSLLQRNAYSSSSLLFNLFVGCITWSFLSCQGLHQPEAGVRSQGDQSNPGASMPILEAIFRAPVSLILCLSTRMSSSESGKLTIQPLRYVYPGPSGRSMTHAKSLLSLLYWTPR